MMSPAQLAQMRFGCNPSPGRTPLFGTTIVLDQPDPGSWSRVLTVPRVQGENDQYGDCVTTAAYNAAYTFLGAQGKPMPPVDNTAPYGLYGVLGGSGDSGLDPNTLFNWWQSNAILGVKLLAANPVSLDDPAGMKQIIRNNSAHGLFTTAVIKTPQFNQLEWQPVGGNTAGGHAFWTDSYLADSFSTTTWGEERFWSPAFIEQQGMEVWELQLSL